MTDKNINDLDPRLRQSAIDFVNMSTAAIAPSKCVITVTYRDAKSQNVAQSLGLSKATAGHSPHNCVDSNGNPASRGFDFAILGPDGSYVSNGADSRYETAGKIGKELGLCWGGDWRMETDGCAPDYDHLQMVNWKTLAIA